MSRRPAGSQYMMLATHLLGRISAGDYPPGALLPGELALCEQFNVSRGTVRGALQELEQRGVVTRRPGIGTRVEEPAQRAAFAHIGANVDEILLFTKGTPIHVLSTRMVTVSDALAAQTELPRGLQVLHLETTRLQDGQPFVLSNHYIPALIAPQPAQVEGIRISLAEWLAQRAGDELMTVRQEIAAVALKAPQARVLGQKAGSPALRSVRWYHGKQDRLLLRSVSLFPAHAYRFTSVLRRSMH